MAAVCLTVSALLAVSPAAASDVQPQPAPSAAVAPAPAGSGADAAETVGDGDVSGSPAVRALENGRVVKALVEARRAIADTTQTSRRQAQARLVRLVASLRLHRFGEALQAIDAVTAQGPQLGSYLTALKVQALAVQQRCSDAETALQELPDGSVYTASSWLRVASCWLRDNDATAALQATHRAQTCADSRSRRAMATLLRARILGSEGQRRVATATYKQVIVEGPLTMAARMANARLVDLREAGRHVGRFNPVDQLDQADLERSLQRIGPARRLYREVRRRTRGRPLLYQRAQLGLVEIEVVRRAYFRALRHLNAVLPAVTDPAVRARALYLRGDLLARLGRLGASLDDFDEMLDTLPDQPFTVEAALSAAKLAYSSRHLERARAYAEWLVHQPVARTTQAVVGDDGVHRSPAASGTRRDQALWLLAWIARRSGAPDESVDSYLAQIDAHSPLANPAVYWRARLALEQGDIQGAEVFARMLAQKAPTSFAALAARDLVRGFAPSCDVRLGVPSLVHDQPAQNAVPEAAPEDLQGPVVLFEYGLHDAARDALRSIPATGLSFSDRVAAAWLYRRCGDLPRGALLARRAAEHSRDLIDDPVLLELAYPRPFADIVQTNAARYHVPVELIYAVMREESSFDPRARSPRFARGLMQMMWATARRMARDSDVHRLRWRQLYNPAVAIQLGTQYLASLLQEFDGNIIAAVASYQAGDRAVSRWLRTRGTLAPDELIEEIPYSTTRDYVKKVLASYGVYRLLYHSGLQQALGLDLAAAVSRHENTAVPAQSITGDARSVPGWTAPTLVPQQQPGGHRQAAAAESGEQGAQAVVDAVAVAAPEDDR